MAAVVTEHDAHVMTPQHSMRWLLVLLVPAFAPSLGVMARNPVGIPHAERLLLVSLAVWLAACLVAVALDRLLGLSDVKAVLVAFIAVVLFFWGGGAVSRFGLAAGIALIVLLLIVLALVLARVEGNTLARAFLWALAVGVITGPAASSVSSLMNLGEDVVSDGKDLTAQMSTTPDIVLVVFDGHPGMRTIEMDFGVDAISEIEADLNSFLIAKGAYSSYWITDYSLPSILNLGHPTTTPVDNDATTQSLYDIISGDSRVNDLLQHNGYETVMVESGWSGSSCGRAYDRCVASPWFDEPMYFMLSRSVVSEVLLQRLGYPFTVGAQSSMRWLLDNAADLSTDGHPSFVFAHVMAPHPPFFLDGNCQVVVTDERSGVSFNRRQVDYEIRDVFLREQMACVRSFMIDLAEKLGDEAIVVFVSDHGTDRRNQLVTDPAKWTHEAQVERMNAFVAVSENACPVGERVTLPNVLRRALSCLVEDGLDDRPDRVFLGPSDEMTQGEVDLLLRSTGIRQ